MGEKKRTLRGFLCAALGGVCWGASGTVGQYLFTRQGVDSGWLTVVRMFLAGVVLLGGALVRHRPQLRTIWSDRRVRGAWRTQIPCKAGLHVAASRRGLL